MIYKNTVEMKKSTNLPYSFFDELATKLNGAGLPVHQVESFVQRYREVQNYDPVSFELFRDHQIPSADCFRTLAEAQRIFVSRTDRTRSSTELLCIVRYLEIPYSCVLTARKTMTASFDRSNADIDNAYLQDPEWLFITADLVEAFASFLNAKFSDRELVWNIYKKAALLGLEKTQGRINNILELLGPEIGEEVIRNDLYGDAWLFYRWFTDPVGCVEYMLECGLTPKKVQFLLDNEPDFLFEYKEGCKHKYNHNQAYIDMVIRKYTN